MRQWSRLKGLIETTIKNDVEGTLRKGQSTLFQFPVHAGEQFILKLGLDILGKLAKDSQMRAGICEFVYYDKSGAFIEGSYEDLLHSELYPNYLYLSVDEGSSEKENVFLFNCPDGAVSVEILIKPFRAKAIRVTSDPKLVAVSSILKKNVEPFILLSQSATCISSVLETSASLRLSGKIANLFPDGAENKPGTGKQVSVLAKFYSSKGTLLDSPGVKPKKITHRSTARRVQDFSLTFTPPIDTERVDLFLSLKDNDHGTVVSKLPEISQLRFSSPDAVPVLAHQPLVFRKSINQFFTYKALLKLKSDDEETNPKAAVLSVRLFDKSGKEIKDSFSGYMHSKKFANFKYLSASKREDENRLLIAVPSGSVFIDMTIHFWKPEGKLEVSLVNLFEHGISDDELPLPDAISYIRETMGKEPATALKILEKVEEKHKLHPTVLDTRYAAEMRLGRLKNILETTKKIHAVRKNKKSAMKLRGVEGLLREMNPSWLPCFSTRKEKLSIEPPSSSNAMRVAHFIKTCIPFENTGGAIRCKETFAEQKHLGIEPMVIMPLGYPRATGEKEFSLHHEIDGVPYILNDFPESDDWGSEPRDLALTYDTFITAASIRDFRPHILHAASGVRGYELALKALALRKIFDIPVIYEVRSFHEHTWAPMSIAVEMAEYTQMRIIQENRCMREADMVVTICERMRTAIAARGIPKEKIHVVPNGVNPDHFPPQDADPALRDELGLSGKILGYVSNISRREGHDILLRAAREMISKGNDISVLIVGDGPEKANLERLALELGMNDRVCFTGSVPHADVARYYALIDLFVVPRRRDFAADYVTPLKPFEALALGKTILISDRPALEEVITPGERGWSFKTEDAMDLAKQAEILLADPVLMKRLAETGRNWVITERNWAMNAKRYEEIYNLVVDQT